MGDSRAVSFPARRLREFACVLLSDYESQTQTLFEL